MSLHLEYLSPPSLNILPGFWVWIRDLNLRQVGCVTGNGKTAVYERYAGIVFLSEGGCLVGLGVFWSKFWKRDGVEWGGVLLCDC